MYSLDFTTLDLMKVLTFSSVKAEPEFTYRCKYCFSIRSLCQTESWIIFKANELCLFIERQDNIFVWFRTASHKKLICQAQTLWKICLIGNQIVGVTILMFSEINAISGSLYFGELAKM